MGAFDDLPNETSAGSARGPFDDLPNEHAAPHNVAGGDATFQILKGIPIVGPLAQKGLAAANAAVDPAVDAAREWQGKQRISPQGTYSERYRQHLDESRGADKQFEEQHPVLAPALQVGGGMAALGAGNRLAMSPGQIQGPPGVWTNIPQQLVNAPARSVGGPLANSVLGGGGTTLPGQIVRSGASGAGLGAADATLRDENAEGGAAVGAITGAAGPVVGRVAGNIVNRLRGTTAAAVPPTAVELENAARANYGNAAASDIRVDPAGLHDMANVVETDLLHGIGGNRARSFHPSRAPDTFAVLRELREGQQMPPAGRFGTAPVGPAPESAQGLLAAQQRLKDIIEAGGTPHGNAVDARAASHVLGQLEHYMEAIPGHHVLQGDPNLFRTQTAEGNANYGAEKRAGRYGQEVLENASRRADVQHAGENLGNTTRQRLDKVILANQRGSELGRGLNQAEIDAMDDAARGDRFTNIMRRVQSYTGGLKRGGAASLAGAALGSAFGPTGAAIGAVAPHAVGDVARRVAERRTVNAAHDIDEMIRRRAPASAAANAAEAQRIATQQGMTRGGALASRAAEPTIANMLQTYFAPQ